MTTAAVLAAKEARVLFRKDSLATPDMKTLYQQTVLNDVLGADWQTVVSEASYCAQTCGDYRLLRLAQVVREHRPNVLARLSGSVVDWLNR